MSCSSARAVLVREGHHLGARRVVALCTSSARYTVFSSNAFAILLSLLLTKFTSRDHDGNRLFMCTKWLGKINPKFTSTDHDVRMMIHHHP